MPLEIASCNKTQPPFYAFLRTVAERAHSPCLPRHGLFSRVFARRLGDGGILAPANVPALADALTLLNRQRAKHAIEDAAGVTVVRRTEKGSGIPWD
jgi:hypothetical protein